MTRVTTRAPYECPVVDCSRRPDQPHKCPVAELLPRSGYHQITTSSGTESRKVGNSGNWNAHLVHITWCQAVDCLVHQ